MSSVSTEIEHLPKWDHVPDCPETETSTQWPTCSQCFFESLEAKSIEKGGTVVRWSQSLDTLDLLLLECKEGKKVVGLSLFRCDGESGSIKRLWPKQTKDSLSTMRNSKGIQEILDLLVEPEYSGSEDIAASAIRLWHSTNPNRSDIAYEMWTDVKKG